MKLRFSTFAPVLYTLGAGLLCNCGDSDDTPAAAPAQAPAKTATQPAPAPEPPAAVDEQATPAPQPTAHAYTGGTLPAMQEDDDAEPVDDETPPIPAPGKGIVFADDEAAELVEEADPLAALLEAPAVTDNMGDTLTVSTLNDTHHFTPGSIIREAENGNNAKLEELLQAGQDINTADEVGYTPLIAAAAAGKADTVRYLLDHGAEVNRCNRLQETALMLAAQKGHAEVVSLLLSAGADKTAVDSLGQTAIRHASRNQHNHIVELLRDAPTAD